MFGRALIAALGLGAVMGAILGIALAFPPLETTEVTRHTITLSNLDCDTRYEVRVRERQNEKWRDARTITRTTDACAEPEPPNPPEPPVGGYTQFPNRATTGTPAGWVPAQTRSTSLTVTQSGAVVQDILFTNGADLTIDKAQNVTVRRVRFEGGVISNQPGQEPCANGLVVEDTEFVPPPGQSTVNDNEGVISYGGYTARRVEIWHRGEGFRASGSSFGCGPITVVDSFADITPPQPCGDWHGDGLQGYGGTGLTLRHTTLILEDAGGTCYGTAPIFYPHNQNQSPSGSVNIDGVLVQGGGIPFRVTTPGPPNWSAVGVRVVNDSWVFFPIDSPCSGLSPFEAKAVTVDANYRVTSEVSNLSC